MATMAGAPAFVRRSACRLSARGTPDASSPRMIFRSPAYELAPCPVCGSAESSVVVGQEEMRAEVEALWAFHTRRLRGETPPAHLADRVAFSHPPPLRVVRCAGCGLVYRNPRERGFELEAMYARAAPEPAVVESLFATQ